MFLTATNLYAYLEDVGLAGPADVADGALTIFEIGRRNRNFRVMRSTGPCLFVKQVPVFAPETRLSFLREAACSQLAIESGAVPALTAIMPRLVRYDPHHQVLAYEIIPDARSVAELLLVPEGIALDLLAAIGGTLARVHVETARPGALAAISSPLTGEPPWVFEVAQRAEMMMPGMGGACREIVGRIRSTPELLDGLSAMAAAWAPACLMHGDFKWDNILVAGHAPGPREVRIVDWELANIGDPAWDVAGILGGLLQIWLLGKPVGGTSLPNPPVTGAVPIETIRHAARHFWRFYAGATAGPRAPDAAELAHLGRMTGVRMVLMAFELGQRIEVLPKEAETALEMAHFLMSNPLTAVRDLLGLDAGTELGQVPAHQGDMPWQLGLRPSPATGPTAL